MARLHDIVIDCARPAVTARFWAAALDGYAVAPYDDAELARLRALGIAGPEDDPTVLVEPRGVGPRLWCRLVPEPKRTRNRLHLDLVSPAPP
ncbi:VOC family protein [Streptomyces ferrugineus]|uniref:VOC family protein n=1 Tax=Streptomyces ferrugineus TaxID=1413221 RepID=A0A7M2SWJ9_9ACTN|nr:VOC family protein [Streptomyces ferrugineus]